MPLSLLRDQTWQKCRSEIKPKGVRRSPGSEAWGGGE